MLTMKTSYISHVLLLKVGDKSLIIHKSAYHLFSLPISKRGFPSLQTRKTFGKIMSGNYRFLIPVIRVMAHNCEYSSFTMLWQSCSDPHPKISPIAIFAFYSLNYSLVARLQDNSRPKSPTKIETKRKLHQFTVSRSLDNKQGR